MKCRSLSPVLIVSLVVFFIGFCGITSGAFGQHPQIATVAFCDLTRNPGDYVGKTVRIRAVILTWLDGESFVDPQCKKAVYPSFACSGQPKCDRAQKRMAANSDSNGDFQRVGAVVIGELLAPAPLQPGATSRPMPVFKIREIESSFKVPRSDPWP